MSINSTFRTLTTDNIEGIVSTKNYVKNSFEDSVVVGWSTCSASIPVDLPVGFINPTALTVGLSTSSISPLYGKSSLIADTGIDPWLKGEGFISDGFLIESGDYNQPFEAYFDYEIVQGASSMNFSGNLGSQTFGVFLYRPSSGTWVQPTGYLGFNNNATVNRMKVEFIADPDVYQLAFICLTGTNISTIKFDNFNVYRKTEISSLISPTSFLTAINNNQSSFTNTGLNVDINSDGFAIDYAAQRLFNSLSLGFKQSIFNNIGQSNANKFPNSSVSSIVIQPDGKILIAGGFSNYAGILGYNYFLRFNVDGTLDIPFNNNASAGSKFGSPVNCISIQSDGKILVGGGFVNYGIAGRSRLVRLNSDGTTDTDFCTAVVDGTKFSSSVSVIQIQPNGQILVGGSFTGYGGTSGRNALIRINTDNTLDTTFLTNAVDGTKFSTSTSINDICVQPDGRILVGGNFTGYGGTAGRSHFLRLNSDGTLDTGFVGNTTDGNKFTSTIVSIAVQSDNKIVIGGVFTAYAGTAGRNRFLRFNSDGTLDTGFVGNATDSNKFPNSFVNKVLIQSDGKVLAIGSFTAYGGVTNRNYLARFNADGTLDTAFSAIAVDGALINGTLQTGFLDSSQNILLGGSFTTLQTIPSARFGVLNPNGSFNITKSNPIAGSTANISNTVRSMAIQPNGQILIGGDFQNFKGVSGRNRLVRLNSDGTVDEVFCVNAADGSKISSNVNSIIVQPDGKILVAGNFANYNGVTNRSRLIRLNSDGTTDTGFCSNASDGAKFSAAILAMALQPDGKILTGGSFTAYGGTANRNRVVRLNSDGTLDTAFCTAIVDGTKFNFEVSTVLVQSDNKLLIGGLFDNYGGTSGRNALIRINADNTLDTTFLTNAVDGSKFGLSSVNALKQQTDGKILAGGAFTNYGGTSGRSRLVRLNSDGTLDTGFVNNATDGSKFPTGTIRSIEVQPDGKILVVGTFTGYNSVLNRNRVVRFNSDGTLDTDFMTSVVDGNKFNNELIFALVDSSYNMYLMGSFTNYQQNYGFFIILNMQPNGNILSQVGVGRFQGYINNLTNAITTLQAYSELGSSGITLEVDSSGNIQYTSNNIYTLPDWEFAGFGYLSLFLDEL
jgi:uncharacterized delta-60 repeat protein